MTDEKLMIVLKELGSEGIDAFYAYLAIEYISLWLIVGLVVWGVRTMWNKRSEW